jgi:hypothetical protein
MATVDETATRARPWARQPPRRGATAPTAARPYPATCRRASASANGSAPQAHADEFTVSVRAARIEAAARAETPATECALAPAGTRSWRNYLKVGACWGAPLVLLPAIPLFWSGNTAAAAGGSILSVLAVLACPLGMFFMMHAMGSENHGGQPGAPYEADQANRRGH